MCLKNLLIDRRARFTLPGSNGDCTYFAIICRPDVTFYEVHVSYGLLEKGCDKEQIPARQTTLFVHKTNEKLNFPMII